MMLANPEEKKLDVDESSSRFVDDDDDIDGKSSWLWEDYDDCQDADESADTAAADADTETINSQNQDRNNQPTSSTRKQNKFIRKASVGIAGAGLVALGVAMIPLPGPGLPTVVAGLHVLGTEFETAKKAENKIINSTKKVGDEIKKRTSSPELRKSASDTKKKVLITSNKIRSDIIDSSKKLGTGIKKRTPRNVRKSMSNAKSKLLRQSVDNKKSKSNTGFENNNYDTTDGHLDDDNDNDDDEEKQ